MEFIVPCLFGLEGLAGDELRRLNMENVRVEDRRVLFSGSESDLAKAFSSPVNRTRRSSTRTFSMFSLRSSSPARPSRPNRQGTISCIIASYGMIFVGFK